MQKKARWTISAFTAGLVLTGTAGAVFNGASPGPEHSSLAADQSAASSVNLDNCPTLTEVYHGGCINQLQSELKADGYSSLVVDGTFGEATRNAVIDFQRAHNVPADGKVGPLTKAALDGVTPPAVPAAPTPPPSVPADTPAPSTPASPLRYVALGDSYSSGEGEGSSGEGEGQFLPGSDTATDTCHRSAQAYSQYVTPKPDKFAACSGQDISALTNAAMSGQEPPQLSWLNQSTGLVTFTFGGNNLDWPTMLWDCTKVQTAVLHNTLFYSSHACYQDLDALKGRIDTMKSELVAAYEQVLTDPAAPNAQVRVLNYPPLFPDRGGKTSGCRIGRFGPFQEVVAADVEQRIVAGEQEANKAIQAAVTQAQATPGGDRLQLVDVTSQFGGYTGHTVSCGDTGRPTPWINSLRLSAAQAAQWTLDAERGNWDQLHRDANDIYSASFHPTPEGHHRMYLALAAALPSGWH